jgi:hypothetical protein
LEAIFEEPLAPLAYDLSRERKAGGNLIVAQPLGGHQNNFGADDLKIR